MFAPHEEGDDWAASRAALGALVASCAGGAGEAPPLIGLPFEGGLACFDDGSADGCLAPFGKDLPLLCELSRVDQRRRHQQEQARPDGLSSPQQPAVSDGLLARAAAGCRYRLCRRAADGCFEARAWLPPLPSDVQRRMRALRRRFVDGGELGGGDEPGGACSYRGPNKYCNWLLPSRVLVGCFPCEEVWRREGGPAAAAAALRALALHSQVRLFVCLDDSEELLQRQPCGLGPPTPK